jgi:hypothetical protein
MRRVSRCDGLHLAGEMVEIVDHRPGPFEHDRTECGGQHATRRALEERRAEHAFQFGQRVRHGGLTAGHMLGDACQRAVLLDVQQQDEMPHLQTGAQPPDEVIVASLRLKCHRRSSHPSQKNDGPILKQNHRLMAAP